MRDLLELNWWRLAALPHRTEDMGTFEPGAFGWVVGGHQWVSLRSGLGLHAPIIGKADVFEERGSLWARLIFDLKSVVPGAFPRTLPTDNLAAARAAIVVRPNVKVIETDAVKGVVTKAQVLGITVTSRDPAGTQIAALLDAAQQEQDRYS